MYMKHGLAMTNCCKYLSTQNAVDDGRFLSGTVRKDFHILNSHIFIFHLYMQRSFCQWLNNVTQFTFNDCNISDGRSQWPRGLRHELFSLARTLVSWVWIQLTVWMCVCVHSFCIYVVLCVGRGLATGWSPIRGVIRTVYKIKKLKSCQGEQSHNTAIIIIIIIIITYMMSDSWTYI
jgi:hypothetical protein